MQEAGAAGELRSCQPLRAGAGWQGAVPTARSDASKWALSCQPCVQVLDGESEPERKTQLEAELKEKQTAFDTLMKQFEVRQGSWRGRESSSSRSRLS